MKFLYIAAIAQILEIFIQIYLFIKIFRFLNPKKKIPAFELTVVWFLLLSIVIISAWFSITTYVDSSVFLPLDLIPILCFWFGLLIWKIRINFKKSLIFLLVYLVLLIGINSTIHFFVKTYSMPSGSMEDTLSQGDYLISDQFYYGHSFFNRTSEVVPPTVELVKW
jgi:hypothetical protein